MKALRASIAFLSCLFSLAQAADQPSPASDSIAFSEAANTRFHIHRTSPVRYPLRLLRDGITHGESRVLIHINAEGRLTETLVLAYTHKPFATAAIEAIKAWRYDPARAGGNPVGTVADITFRFEVDGILVVERSGVPQFSQQDTFRADYVYKPHGLRTLDLIPTPLHVIEPAYSAQWIQPGIRHEVLVDFYIDETGVVRMPSIIDAAGHPRLAAAATAAVRQWRFAPPLHKGKPVLAHCQQVFVFESAPSVAPQP